MNSKFTKIQTKKIFHAGPRAMCVGAGSAFVPECVYVLDLQLQSIIYKVNIELVCFDVITVNVKDNTHYYYNVIKLFTRVCSVCYFCPNFSDSSPQTCNIYVLRCK